MKKIFVVTDNKFIYNELNRISKNKNIIIDYFCSPKSSELFKEEINSNFVNILLLKDDYDTLFKHNYNLGLSCHSKQLFPIELINNIKCINIHPGLNPYNRGWFPQVFSIINKLPIGATIHIMDEKIDHGDIIVQEEIKINSHDTSLEVYNKVQIKEIELLEKNFNKILNLNFKQIKPFAEGNYNSIDYYKKLCKIDLKREVTMLEAIDYLRAMTHFPYKNSYFIDENGDKIFVSIKLEKEN